MARKSGKRSVSPKVRPAALRRKLRLQLEALEDRCQPSVTGFSPIDEVGNNTANPDWGAAPADQPGGAAIQLLRVSPTAYTDGVSTPSLTYTKVNGVNTIPSPRTISNDVFNQSPSLFGSPSTDVNTVDGNGLSDFGYSFGQFMDHDMDLTPTQSGPAPAGDPAANKDGGNGFPIPADTTNPGDPIGSLDFSRSVFDPTSETSVSITGASWANGVATITAANTFTAGQPVAITGLGGFNSPNATIVNGVITPAAPFTILSANGSSFTYALATNPGTVTNFTAAFASSGLREQTNVDTAYLDLSQVYGSSQVVSDALRTFSGGLLKTSPGNLLPYDNLNYFTQDQINALNMADSGPLPESSMFAAGDVRANENTELMSLTTLFVRNHNAIATELAQQNPSWTDEQVFQEARKLNIAEYQNIIYTQYLPDLLGPDYAPQYTGYDPTVNASISTEFSTVGFRFGHSMLNNTVNRDNNDGSSAGALQLAQDFFNPNLVNPNGVNVQLFDANGNPITVQSTDIGAYLKGDADGTAQAVDSLAVSDVRDLLFGNATPPGTPSGEDLIARDIWRARDDGIGNYNDVRAAYGLPAITNTNIAEIDPVTNTHFISHGFEQITSDVHVQFELETAYAGLIATGGFAGQIDPFVAGMAEDHLPGSDMGPLFTAILSKQFTNLAVGDQYFYLNESFTPAELGILNQGVTLGQIITTNTGVTNLQNDVFLNPVLSAQNAVGKGFFTNKNGEAALTGSKTGTTLTTSLYNNLIAVLDPNGTGTTSLVGANGNQLPDTFFLSYANVQSFLQSATGQNAANMLSAQLLTTEFDVLLGKVDASSSIYLPALGLSSTEQDSLVANGVSTASGVANIQNILDASLAALQSGSTDTTYLGALKDCLNGINNNGTIFIV